MLNFSVGGTHRHKQPLSACRKILDAFNIIRDSSGTSDDPSLDEVLLMVQRFRIRVFAILLFFVFCQIAGIMCALPDVAPADEGVAVSEAGMTCPMDTGMSCSPLITSSADRQIKHSSALNLAHSAVLHEQTTEIAAPSVALTSLNRSHPLVLPPSACLEVLRI